MHIAQRSEAETGQARDWVARHFRLRDEGTIVYYQNADDPPQHARGIVPLSGFDRVEQATVRCPGRRDPLLPLRSPIDLPSISHRSPIDLPDLPTVRHVLICADARLNRASSWAPPPLPHWSSQPPSDNLPYAFRLTARDGAPDGGVVLAAPTEEERNLWINHLSSALGAARAARDGADGATSKLSGALEKTSLS